jgi:1-acyl-sn-glycerol-3-phosphate acyltransferase
VALNSGQFWGRKGITPRPGRIVLEILPPIAPGLARGRFMEDLQAGIETATRRLIEEGQLQPAAATA